MSNEVAKSTEREVAEAMDNAASRDNMFRPLVTDARRVLRRAMLNGRDQKLAVQVAQDVLDRAGETKKSDNKQVAPVIITDSQVNLLVQAFNESLEG